MSKGYSICLYIFCLFLMFLDMMMQPAANCLGLRLWVKTKLRGGQRWARLQEASPAWPPQRPWPKLLDSIDSTLRIQVQICKQSFLQSIQALQRDRRNLTEKHARQRETCGTDLHPQHQQQSMSLLRRQNCPQSAWMHQRCHTWGQLFCWTKCLMWAPWLCFWKRLLWHQIFTSFELQFLQTPGILLLQFRLTLNV